MEKFEEKLKEFFGDKEKVKEFVKDEEFIDKVSEGTATEQNYIDEFKKFGVELTSNEAAEISKVMYGILNASSVEELDDELASKIAGGSWGLTFLALRHMRDTYIRNRRLGIQ